MCAIHLGPAPKREVQRGRDFVRPQKVQFEYNEWFKSRKKEQLDGLSKRLVKRALTHIEATREKDLVEMARRVPKEGALKVGTLRPKTADLFILKNLHISPEKREKALKILEEERDMSAYYGFALVKAGRVPRKPFVELAQSALAKYEKLNEHRKADLKQFGFSLEKTSARVTELSRSGAKQYLPEQELIYSLKQINSAYLSQTIGSEAAYIYYDVYGKIKTRLIV